MASCEFLYLQKRFLPNIQITVLTSVAVDGFDAYSNCSKQEVEVRRVVQNDRHTGRTDQQGTNLGVPCTHGDKQVVAERGRQSHYLAMEPQQEGRQDTTALEHQWKRPRPRAQAEEPLGEGHKALCFMEQVEDAQM